MSIRNSYKIAQSFREGNFSETNVGETDGFQLSCLLEVCHPEATVGEVEKVHRSEASILITELASAASAEKGIVFDESLEERLCAYSRVVSHFPTAVKEKAVVDDKPDPCPLHTEWLKELKIV